MRKAVFTLLVLPLLLAACERGDAPEAERPGAELRRQAELEACLAGAIAERARDSRETLELFGADNGQVGGPAQAATRFAQAYEAAAELRHTALAYADSALNHAPTAADSTRYMERARNFRPRVPEPGTLEDNVSAAWLRDFRELLADEDHPCHWDR